MAARSGQLGRQAVVAYTHWVSISILSADSSYASALSPEYALLGLLTQQPAHGYELCRRLVAELGQVWHISLSQTYNILNRLEAHGWIAGARHEQVKLPAKRTYQLTEAGRLRFEAWLAQPTGCSVRAIRVEFITRLYFARSLDPGRIEPVIDAQLDDLRAGLAGLEQIRVGIPPEQTFNRLAVELRIRQLGSICDWLEGCRLALASAGDGNDG